MDGEYEIRPRLTRDLNESLPLYAEDQRLEISIDGERVGLYTLPGIGGAADTPPESRNPHRMPALPRIPNPEPRIRTQARLPVQRSLRFNRPYGWVLAKEPRAIERTNRGTCACP